MSAHDEAECASLPLLTLDKQQQQQQSERRAPKCRNRQRVRVRRKVRRISCDVALLATLSAHTHTELSLCFAARRRRQIYVCMTRWWKIKNTNVCEIYVLAFVCMCVRCQLGEIVNCAALASFVFHYERPCPRCVLVCVFVCVEQRAPFLLLLLF